ncbi:YcdB/YcdC domain-containing protein [Sinanaerobacter sp. ZZT-01]|uniref:YcdB/YcdC domain-containing protein n=1 Tax=Sinanaerobacter sp. ZZT-01 TaxID=3111540 RepID=UPI002D7948F0|nr:YcdB/YcdC domain-containing protein [Sinanaerobacter sp. ZZT-01]WRR93210.1 YcdB/YcdC domain-containing protein [Sinanaerobacter sp. ZZT-01]
MKKTWSILLCLTLLFTSSISVFATDSESKELEKVILSVKSVISIPENFTKFSNYSRQEELDDKSTITIWELSWSNEDRTENLNVSVDSNGNFLSYRLYKERDKEGLSNTTRKAGEKTALAFLKKVLPKYASYFRQVDEAENQMNTYNLSYTFQPYINDVPAQFIEAAIRIDKYSGEVISFSLNGDAADIGKIPSKEGILSKEEAEKAYLEQFGMNLKYYSYYNWKDDKFGIFPAYINSAKQNQALDAKTGKIVKISLPIIFYGEARGMGDKAVAEEAGSLTPEEQEQVDTVAGLISKEKADTILKAAFEEIGYAASYKASLKRIENSPNKGQYIWDLSYEKSNGRVDAKTGEIVSYHHYYDEDANTKSMKVDEKNAVAAAETLISKILSADKLGSLERIENEYNEENPYYSVCYNRRVNGINYSDNYVDVTVNRKTGKISRYNLRWYANVEFPSIENAMDKQKAYAAYKDLFDLSLSYEKIEKDGVGEIGLVYNFESVNDNCMIHPETGSRIDRDGKEYKEEKGIPVYTDIKGHWSETVVNQLKENGYYLAGEKFMPNNKISQKEFLIYLYPYYRDYEEDEMYETLIEEGMLKKGEENPNAALRRQEAAKLMIRFLHLEIAAEHPELFQTVFKDNVEYSYKGYATLSKGLGILSEDKNGKFNGKNMMTRAEAASAIHRLLNISN